MTDNNKQGFTTMDEQKKQEHTSKTVQGNEHTANNHQKTSEVGNESGKNNQSSGHN